MEQAVPGRRPTSGWRVLAGWRRCEPQSGRHRPISPSAASPSPIRHLRVRWELGVAIRLARNDMPNLIRRAPRNTKFTMPADWWAVRAAQRVLTFVPPDSDLARQAHLLIDDPAQLLGERSTGIDALVGRLVPGTLFQGKWMCRMPYGPPMRQGPLTKERLKKLAALTHRTSACTLQINMCNPKTLAVTATLRLGSLGRKARVPRQDRGR